MKPSGQPDLQAIEQATENEYAEQNLWCERLDELKRLNLPTNAIAVTKSMGFGALWDRMEAEGATYPPTSQLRRMWYEGAGEEWHISMCPNRQKTRQVKDEKLRFSLQHLLDIGQHKERIKSRVLLPSILRVDPDHEETEGVFSLWFAFNVIVQLEKEFPFPEDAGRDVDFSEVLSPALMELVFEPKT